MTLIPVSNFENKNLPDDQRIHFRGEKLRVRLINLAVA